MKLKSYKYRIYPTEKQKILIEKHFGCCRWIYNYALEKNIKSYQETRKHLSKFIISADLKLLKTKEETKWLSEVNSQSLQTSLENLDKAFTSFFKKKTSFPKFKSKNNKDSFSCVQQTKIDFKKSVVYIMKFREGIKCKFDREFVGKIKTSTVSKTPTGKYFISILVETDEIIPEKKPIDENQAIAIDLGIKSFATFSDGKVIDNPRHLKNSLKRLKRAQKKHSKKKKGSNNREKSRIKLAILHEKIVNQRKDFLHKVTSDIVKNYDTVCLEALNVKGMMKNHKLAQAIGDVGWGYFNQFLEYKAEWNGKNILRIGQFEPSSKTCNNCGNIDRELKLSDRVYKCKSCGTSVDRDLNAALVIKNIALLKQNTVGHTEI